MRECCTTSSLSRVGRSSTHRIGRLSHSRMYTYIARLSKVDPKGSGHPWYARHFSNGSRCCWYIFSDYGVMLCDAMSLNQGMTDSRISITVVLIIEFHDRHDLARNCRQSPSHTVLQPHLSKSRKHAAQSRARQLRVDKSSIRNPHTQRCCPSSSKHTPFPSPFPWGPGHHDSSVRILLPTAASVRLSTHHSRAPAAERRRNFVVLQPIGRILTVGLD